jgi:transposase
VVVRTLAFVIVRRVLGLVGLGSTPDSKDVEVAVLRHQLMVLRRQVARPRYQPSDRMVLARRFKALRDAGATYAEIAAEVGCDWRTVRKYLSSDASSTPPAAPSRRGSQPRCIDPVVGVVEGWLRTDIAVRASVIHERLVAEYGFTGSYQRVKLFVQQARPRLAAQVQGDENPLRGLHRRFEALPGAQAQVDWGDEGGILAGAGIAKTYSFHMVLSYSRDPFCCYVTSMDAATFWDCHRRAFAHFGGVPAAVVYDRTKTVVKRHVRPGLAVPLHPEAAAFAAHYGFTPDVLAVYRPERCGWSGRCRSCASTSPPGAASPPWRS